MAGPTQFNHVSANRVSPYDESKPPAQLTKDNILEAVEGSLRRLQTDYIDLYQIHWPSRYVPVFGSRQYHEDKVRECVDFEEQVLCFPDSGFLTQLKAQSQVEACKRKQRHNLTNSTIVRMAPYSGS